MANILKRAARALVEPEGAATAIGAGWLFGPVAGLGLGIVQGILSRRLKKSELDKAAAEESSRVELDQELSKLIEGAGTHADSDIDRAQLNVWATRQAQMRKLATHPDPKVRSKALEELANVTTGVGTWLEDVESRRESTDDTQLALQRQTVTDLAKGLRTTYEKTIEARRELQTSAGQIHQLLNDPGFDPNKPLNRGRLVELMRTNSRQILADPADFGDALQGAGGGGLVGSVLGLIGGAMKAEDFKFSKDEWRTIATAMYDYEGRQFANSMKRIEQGVVELEPAAHSLGVLPPEFGLAQYVLGATEENFQRPYTSERYPEFRSADAPPPTGNPGVDNAPLRTQRGGFADFMRWLQKQGNEAASRNRRPTN